MTPETRELLAFSEAARDQAGKEGIAMLFFMLLAGVLVALGADRDSWRITSAAVVIAMCTVVFFVASGHRRRKRWDELFNKAMEVEHRDG